MLLALFALGLAAGCRELDDARPESDLAAPQDSASFSSQGGRITATVVLPPELRGGDAEAGINAAHGSTSFATLRAIIQDSGNVTLVQQDFSGTATSGTITSVPAGSNRTLTVQALDSSGITLAEGSATGLTVNIGQTTSAGTITLALVGGTTAEGNEFYLAFQRNLGTPTLTLFITGTSNTTGTVEISGLSFSDTFSVTADQITSVSIPAGAAITTSDLVENLGIHVSALAPVMCPP